MANLMLSDSQELIEPRRTGRGWHMDDISLLLGSAISAAALTWVLIVQLTTIHNIVGLYAIWFITFVAVYRVVTHLHQGRLAARDKMMNVLIASAFLLVFMPLFFIISYVITKGAPAINGDFFTQDLSVTGTLDQGGGAAHFDTVTGVDRNRLGESQRFGRGADRENVRKTGGRNPHIAGVRSCCNARVIDRAAGDASSTRTSAMVAECFHGPLTGVPAAARGGGRGGFGGGLKKGFLNG